MSKCRALYFRCGNEDPCDDARTAHPHAPSLPAVGVKQIDVIVGTKARCIADSCQRCNEEPGCGWCPGYCEGKAGSKAGKCMIGGSSPTFDTCPKSLDGRGFRQCEKSELDLVPIAAGAASAFVVILVLAWRFEMFVRRRHGSVFKYVSKRFGAFKRKMQSLHLYPPDEANYTQFFVLMALLSLTFLVFGILRPGIDADCNFSSEVRARSLSRSRARAHTYAGIHTHLHTQVFLDSAVTVKLLSDKCTIRFLPARKEIFPSPRDYEVSALKAKVALQKHSDITLSLDTCNAENSIIVSNGLPVDVRYKTYFCNIALLVPADFIIPSTVIEDFNGFSTQVRPRVMRALTSLRVLRTRARARARGSEETNYS